MSLGSRAAALERLAATTAAEPLDLLVVGGGITGAGVALDAASRGMTVGLVERNDFASGTSSKSSKLVHGGLRYLEQREFGLMREASTERDLLRRLAPHLVEPVPFALPVSDRYNRARFGVGLWAYDALASFKNMHVHRHLDADETEALMPALPKGRVKGGYLFYDCKTDDVRLVMEVLVQARRYGASMLNYARVTDLDGARNLCRAVVEDATGGGVFGVYARRVVVAAGVWTDKVEALANPDASDRLRPSKGIHLLFSKDTLPTADAAGFIPDADNKRFLFVIPWLDAVVVGTTDTAYGGELDRPSVESSDRAYCLDALNAIFGLGLDDSDIAGAYAGLRPLIAGKAGATADLSRNHTVYDIAPGILGITGGKLTTYRRMALDAVDRVTSSLGMTAKSRTHWIRLGSRNVGALEAAVQRRAARLGITPSSVANLVRCYGDRALDVLDVADATGQTEPLAPGHFPIAAEATYCARTEMVVHLADLLARRTRLALTDHAAGIGRGAVGADILAGELKWGRSTKRAEIAEHRSQIEAERGLRLLDAAPAPPERESTG